jgi:hypothetical protein
MVTALKRFEYDCKKIGLFLVAIVCFIGICSFSQPVYVMKSIKAVAAIKHITPDETGNSKVNNPVETPIPDVVSIKLTAAGDCTLGNQYGYDVSPISFFSAFNQNGNGYSYFFKNAKKWFVNDDLSIINLEGPLTTSENVIPKEFNFSGDPKYVNILKDASIESVSLSNNHMFDFSQTGYDDTISALNGAKINYM